MNGTSTPLILITGSTDGIGLGAAQELARTGSRILLHGRSEERLAAARSAVEDAVNTPQVECYLADFSSLAEVRRLAHDVAARHDGLDVLVNNAGIGMGAPPARTRELSRDGFELRFQVNYLAPFLLQKLLLPLLRRRAAETGRPSRIVNVASAAQSPIDFDDPMLEHGYDGYRAYAQSKLALVMACFELAGRVDPAEVTVNALHPGTLVDTKMVREGGFGRPQEPLETGVRSEVHLAVAPELDGVTGTYFDRTRTARANRQAYDEAARERLWSLSEEWVGES